MKLNHDKSIFSTTTICLFGHHKIRSDPEDIKITTKDLGLFSYYSKWNCNFSDKITPLTSNTMFPLLVDALKTFQNLKSDIENSVVTIDKHIPFVM